MEIPDVITIFRRPIEKRCDTRERVVEEIRLTVIHEIAHHFGIAEQSLEGTAYQ